MTTANLLAAAETALAEVEAVGLLSPPAMRSPWWSREAQAAMEALREAIAQARS